MSEMKNTYKLLTEKTKRRTSIGDQVLDRGIILKCELK
jgi:hypothetical protein